MVHYTQIMTGRDSAHRHLMQGAVSLGRGQYRLVDGTIYQSRSCGCREYTHTDGSSTWHACIGHGAKTVRWDATGNKL